MGALGGPLLLLARDHGRMAAGGRSVAWGADGARGVRRTIYAVVGCDACGTPDDKGVAIAAEHQKLIQLCNPCLYEMWQESTRGSQFEKLCVDADEGEDIDVPVTRKANYYGPDWPAVRERILERDEGKCQGGPEHDDRMNGGDLRIVVHHKKPLREFGGDYNAANVPENLITLCTVCHGRAHSKLYHEAKAARAQQQ